MLKIAITTGDSAGIGPEVVEKALTSGQLPADAEYLVLGVSRTAAAPSPATALSAWDALEQAVALANAGEVDAIITAPIHKHAMYSVGFPFPGHTEFFASRTGTSDYAMLLTGGPLTVALVTTHIPLSQVAGVLTTAEIVRVGLLLAKFLCQRANTTAPRIAVAGLNPHAGENGSIGREEIEIIEPAVAILRDQLPLAHIVGPIPPDTLFHRAAAGEFDGVLCMYHDQGLIPLKMLAFDTGVNVTLGLPIIRTSPDHGTAFDIAGKNRASANSMIAAIQLAVELARHRQK